MVTAIQKQRHVELKGTTNLRNLGGYTTEDGKTTKWGIIYRCDQLAEIPADKVKAVLLDQLHVHHSYDLRSDIEVASKSYNITGITRHSHGIDTHTMAAALKERADAKTGPGMTRIMEEIYREFVRDHSDKIGAIIKNIVANRCNTENAALVHCTAGKDRTGLTCYMILSLLGVKEEDKIADYLLTNQYFQVPKDAVDYLGGLGLNEAGMKALWCVEKCYLDAALEEIEKHGGPLNYAKTVMHISDDEIAALKEMMLE